MSAAAASSAAAGRVRKALTGNTLYHLLAKLPNNGVGARVAPITWAINNSANSYYTVTSSKLHWVPRLTANGYPLVLVEGGVVPADEKYSAIQYEKARTRREELIRATRAGEELDDLDDLEEKEVELTPEQEEEVGRKAGILKPRGEAYGWGIWNGQPMERLGTEAEPKLITEHAVKYKWREVSDDSKIHLYELRRMMPKQHKRSVNKIV